MTMSGSLLGWVETRSADEFVGAFVSEYAALDAGGQFAARAPATQVCSSPEEARRWIKHQAEELDLPVKWVSGAARG
jgi:hypothetical protein